MKLNFTIVLFALFMNGCGIFKGTNTGNPGISNDQHSNPAGFSTYADSLSSKICLSMNRCFPTASVDLCLTSNRSNTQIPIELKIDLYHSTLESIRSAELQSQLMISSINAQTCFSTIESLSCDSTEIINSFNPSDSSNFDNSFWLLKSDQHCGLIYTPIE